MQMSRSAKGEAAVTDALVVPSTSAGSLAAAVSDWSPGPTRRVGLIGRDTAIDLLRVLGQLAGPEPEAVLPLLWHWVYFLEWPAADALGEDGHPHQGEFLPPILKRRRMFAGGRVSVRHPLTFEAPTERSARLARTSVKSSRSGDLLFVTVASHYVQSGRTALAEEQDLVYRSGTTLQAGGPRPPAGPSTAPPQETIDAAFETGFRADPALLFRFSALTANAHRIHYDRNYAQDVEGYPELVVHGPLLVLGMTELWRSNVRDQPVTAIRYQLRRPVFAGEQVTIVGDGKTPGRLAVIGPDRTIRAEAWINEAQEQRR